jgi:hypothetical protein
VAVAPAPKGTEPPPRAGDQADGDQADGDQADGREEMTPVVDLLPDPSSTPIGDRLCILFLSAFAVIVPVLTIRTKSANIARDVVLGVSYTLPTMLLVQNANERAHTKWFRGECAVLVVGVLFQLLWMTFLADKSPRGVAFYAIALSMTLPLVRNSCRGNKSRADRRRISLLIAVAWGQFVLYLIAEGIAFYVFIPNPLLRFQGFGAVLSAPLLCSCFVIGMLKMDRKKVIEHNVPYAVAQSWALNFSVLGSSYLAARVLAVAFFYGDEYLLVVQSFLALFCSIVLWMISQISRRITTAHDEMVFMFPGFFALVGDTRRSHIPTRTYTHTNPHIRTHTHKHTHTHTQAHT